MKKFIENINDNIHKVKTEVNHLELVSILVFLSIICYITDIDLGFNNLQSEPFALIIPMGLLVMIGIIYKIYRIIGRGK